MNYYNEFDKHAAQWLRNLIADGMIPAGDVDERSIEDVRASDLRGYTQCHFFAGIGGWSEALRLAGWPADRPVWTGSCPCQSFSSAGKRKGTEDKRHLWPVWFELVKECRPPVIFGEQVEAAIKPTGVHDQIESLQQMQTREAYLRVLAELQGKDWRDVLRMQAKSKKAKAFQPTADFFEPESLETQQSRRCIGECCSSQGKREGVGLRHNRGMGPENYRYGSLSSHGNTVRPRYPTGMECTFPGSYKQLRGLHNGEHTSCHLCSKCDDEHMGGTEDFGSIDWDSETTAQKIGEALEFFSRQAKKTNQYGWLDLVFDDLEDEDYTCGAAVLPACSVGAPHIRKRLFFMAHSNGCTSRGDSGAILGKEIKGQWGELQDGNRFGDGGKDGSMAYCFNTRPQRWVQRGQDSEWQTEHGHAGCHSTTVGVDNALPLGCNQGRQRDNTEYDGLEPCTTIQNDWNRSDWIYCRDEKYRPIEPGTLPLADGVPGRMVKIRGYGNAIVPQVAAVVIKAGMAYLDEVAA